MEPSFVLESGMPPFFGRYKVVSLLGEGAMGRVFCADDPMLERRVAIKVIAIDRQTEQKTREEYLNRFAVEARACARLNHPSIVAIFDAGEQDGLPWIAFEYVDGWQLESLLHAPELMAVERVVAITLDIASALHHAHESGIIHRDVKPANILIDRRTGIAKLSDFGVVKAPWVALTQDGSAVGSPGYMSPEQLSGSGTNAGSDLFSLGIVVYQMLSGRHPFLRDTLPATIFATLHGNYPSVAKLRPDTPVYLMTIVKTLLEPDPSKRFKTAAMLLHELRCGSRPDGQHPVSFDKNPLVGNVTRMRRIACMLHTVHAGRKTWITAAGEKVRALKRVSASIVASTAARKMAALHTTIMTVFAKMAALPAGLGTIGSTVMDISAAAMVVVLLWAVFGGDAPRYRELKVMGLYGSLGNMADSCGTMVDSGYLTAAAPIAEKLSQTKRFSTRGTILLCRIALKAGRIGDAGTILANVDRKAKLHPSDKAVVASFVADAEALLLREKADSLVVSVVAEAVSLGHRECVSGWITRPEYWLRWNGVKVAGWLGMEVDSVAVYLLDLQHGGSSKTRTRAATRLGELGDKRAIEPLRRAADRGLRDPVVSYTADLVLRNYFNDEEKIDRTGGRVNRER